MANVTEQEVHQACLRIDEAGQKWTAERVRQELGGRGSYTTIRKHIVSWEKGQSATDVPPLPTVLEKAVSDFAAQTWIASYRAAAALAEETCAALKAEAAGAEDELRELGEFNAMLEGELKEKETAVAELTTRLAAAEERMASLASALQESKRKNHVLHGQLAAHEAILQRLQVSAQYPQPEQLAPAE